tara:strand:- start:3412 stop:5424 length:2013 start_codon:yes stop_codon:yes gene_type:complete
VAKITRKKLARGTKLQVDQMHGPLESAAAQISGANITADQLGSDESTFRVNLWVPHIGMQLFQPYNRVGLFTSGAAMATGAKVTRTDPGSRPFGIPFILPPTQELFSVSGSAGSAIAQMDKDTPTAVLEEISFSFDQRGEPCAIADNFHDDKKSVTHYADSPGTAYSAAQRQVQGMWGSSRYQGMMDFRRVDAYNLKLAIMSKSQYYFGASERRMEREVWSLDIPFDAYSGEHLRENPILISDIAQAMHPYKSYVFLIYCPDLNGGEYIGWDNTVGGPNPPNIGQWTTTTAMDSHALVSVNVSMRFRQKLMTRDKHSGSSVVQNIPSSNNGVIDSYTLSITKPSAGDKIEADNASDGFSTNMHAIDKVFRDKLKGGYDKEARTAPRQELAQDAGYEIIAVPLMNNRRWGAVLSGYYARCEPYMDKDVVAQDQVIADRRFIPLAYPVTIHHAFLAWNWMVPGVFNPTAVAVPPGAPADTGWFAGPQLIKPNSTTFKVEVGIGLTSFLRADGPSVLGQPYYSRVAYHSMLDPTLGGSSTWNDTLIDRMKIHDFSLGDETVGNTAENWDWEMHQIPLYTAAGFAGVGHYAQGDPYFAGRSARDESARQSSANAVRQANGFEQMIEVRMHLTDATNKMTDSRNLTGVASALPRELLLSGYQGHFVYLVCKKHLA